MTIWSNIGIITPVKEIKTISQLSYNLSHWDIYHVIILGLADITDISEFCMEQHNSGEHLKL